MKNPFRPSTCSVASSATSWVRRGLILACSSLLSFSAAAQIEESTVPLVPALPNYIRSGPGDPYRLENYRLTVGDLNADGVEDLVFSNSLAFLRVYFLETVAGALQVHHHYDILPNDPFNGNQCNPLTGANARFRTIGEFSFDSPLIYDINLDGTNELIYLEHKPNAGNGEIHLRVYKYNPTNGRMKKDNHFEAGNLLPLLKDASKYFATGCNTANKLAGESFHLRVVNVRGRAVPQDILVWVHEPILAQNFRVYKYDTTSPSGFPALELLMQHGTDGLPHSIRGLAGHTWRALDINYDGKEEIIGKHVLAYDPSAPGNKQVLWGIILKDDFSLPENISAADMSHPDHISGDGSHSQLFGRRRQRSPRSRSRDPGRTAHPQGQQSH